MKKSILAVVGMVMAIGVATAQAETIGSVDSGFKMLGPNNSIEVESVVDPAVEGITCHISYAKTGGLAGALNLASDPSRFSIACRQTGPLTINGDISKQTQVSAFSRNVFFKEMLVTRMFDKKNNTLIYLVHSKKLIDGSPYNAISSIPLMPWGTKEPVFK